jgi:hypothetical protein
MLFSNTKRPFTQALFLNCYGTQQSIPRIDSASLKPSGPVLEPIPTWFLAPIDCQKIPAQ